MSSSQSNGNLLRWSAMLDFPSMCWMSNEWGCSLRANLSTQAGVFPVVCRYVLTACDRLWFQNEDQANTGASVQLPRWFRAPPSQIVRTSFRLASGFDSQNISVCRAHPLVPKQELLQGPQERRQWLALSSCPVWSRLVQVHSQANA